jgi:tetratricopeptide (TPR) repeat protein
VYAQREEAGEAALRLGYIRMKTKDSAGALAEFEQVARGQIPAQEAIRLEAMVRCAKLYHAGKDRVKTLQAYRECSDITDRTSFDPALHLEIAGLYMELARSGAGSLDDCIHECNLVINVVNIPAVTRATAMQMKAECFYFQKKYDLAISQAKEILEKTPEVKTMCMLAEFYSGLSYLGKRYYYEAVRSFDKVINNYSDKDNLRGNDLRRSSLLYKGKSYLLMGDKERAKGIFSSILKNYPQSKEAEEANKLVGAIQ